MSVKSAISSNIEYHAVNDGFLQKTEGEGAMQFTLGRNLVRVMAGEVDCTHPTVFSPWGNGDSLSGFHGATNLPHR